MRWDLVAQGGASPDTLAGALRKAVQGGAYDRLDVAVAYATLQGVKAIEQALNLTPRAKPLGHRA